MADQGHRRIVVQEAESPPEVLNHRTELALIGAAARSVYNVVGDPPVDAVGIDGKGKLREFFAGQVGTVWIADDFAIPAKIIHSRQIGELRVLEVVLQPLEYPRQRVVPFVRDHHITKLQRLFGQRGGMRAAKKYLDAGIDGTNAPRQFKRLIRGARDDRESQDVRAGKALPIVHVQAPRCSVVLWVERDDVIITRAAANRFEQGHTASGIPEQRVNVFRDPAVQAAIDRSGQLYERNAQILHRCTGPFREQRGRSAVPERDAQQWSYRETATLQLTMSGILSLFKIAHSVSRCERRGSLSSRLSLLICVICAICEFVFARQRVRTPFSARPNVLLAMLGSLIEPLAAIAIK